MQNNHDVYKLKKELREKILDIRSKLTHSELQEKSAVIFEKLKNLEEFKKSRFIMCFVDFKNEVITHGFIEECLKSGKRVAVPIIASAADKTKIMEASEVLDIGEDLEKGYFGIESPKKDRVRIIDPKELDFIVVPGNVFDPLKNRIGYGAGFYDCFFGRVRPDCSKVAVAFDLQIVEQVPHNEQDVPVDKIITENRTIE